MQNSWRTILIFMVLVTIPASADEHHRGALGKTSAGIIDMSLRLSGEVRAGLLRRNPGSDLKALISSGLVQGLQEHESATLSLCILSSGGGMFEVTSLELPGQVSAFSQFGASVPLRVGFGAQGLDAVKHRAVEDGCTQNAIVPVTINLQEDSGPEFGRIHGSLKLLVKSE